MVSRHRLASFGFCRHAEMILSRASAVHEPECVAPVALRGAGVLSTEPLQLCAQRGRCTAEVKTSPVLVLGLPVRSMSIWAVNHCMYSILISCLHFFFFLLPFYFLGLKVASGSCHSLRSVNFLLPIKMQIHISMQCVMGLCKPWGFLHSILYWPDFNLDCLSKLCRFLKVQ